MKPKDDDPLVTHGVAATVVALPRRFIGRLVMVARGVMLIPAIPDALSGRRGVGR